MSTTARLTLAQYDRMIDAGVFDEDEHRRLEFIRGEIREMNPIGSRHEEVLDRLAAWSFRSVPEEKIRVRIQSSLSLPALESAPEPDLAWVTQRDYSAARPTPDDVLLVVEVAETSLAYDCGEKAGLYAAGGLGDYWVVNLAESSIEVRREPVGGRYRSLQTVVGRQAVHPPAFPQAVLSPAALWEKR